LALKGQEDCVPIKQVIGSIGKFYYDQHVIVTINGAQYRGLVRGNYEDGTYQIAIIGWSGPFQDKRVKETDITPVD